MAGSQFFDIDWSLLDAEGIVSATIRSDWNASPASPAIPEHAHRFGELPRCIRRCCEAQRTQAASLYQRLRQLVKPGETPWLSLTGYELEPHCFSVVKRAISTESLLDMEYTDGAGRAAARSSPPSKIFVDEGVYYAAVWTERAGLHSGGLAQSSSHATSSSTRRTASPHMAGAQARRIEHAEVIAPVKRVDIPDMPVSELRKWSFDNGTPVGVHHGSAGSSVHQVDAGSHRRAVQPGRESAYHQSSDSWFVAFCIAHARHITAVAPETLRTMIVARAQRELSLGTREEDTPEEE